ncbi:unnamed protein product [Arctogadus glacialis]
MQLGPCLRFSPPPSLSLSLSPSISFAYSLSLPLPHIFSPISPAWVTRLNVTANNSQIASSKKGVDVMLYDFSKLTVWKLRAVLYCSHTTDQQHSALGVRSR